MPAFPLIPVIILVSIAAFFSATETALFSLSKFQLRQLRQKNLLAFHRVKHLLDRPAALVATVLLGNEMANVFTSNILANYYEKLELSSAWVTLINLLTVMPIILILGEITPKIMGAKANVAFINKLLSPLWWFYRASFPLRFLLESIVELLTKSIRKRAHPRANQIKEEDIKQLLEEGKRKGVIHSIEQDIIENLFNIDDDKVIDLATPLDECFMVQQEENPNFVLEKIKKKFHARIPVYSEDKSQIVGILFAKDLLKYIQMEESEMKVRDIMKPAFFVDPKMKVEVLFRRLRNMKLHIAIIGTENHALAVATMDDILDQLFGELWEESK